jgi:hypothetical protein
MRAKQKRQPSHAEHVARRAFIKKAALGAAFAVPAIESLTNSDMLIKSALAATVPSWTITVSVNPAGQGTGTALPVTQTVPHGGNAIITVTPSDASFWTDYQIDGNVPVHNPPAQLNGGTIPFTNVTANHVVLVWFGPM